MTENQRAGDERTRALALFMTIYAVDGTGGPIHVQIDDMNLDDVHLREGALYADWNSGVWSDPYPNVVARMVVDASVELIAILRSWPLEERERFISYAHQIHAFVDYHWNGSPWTS